MKKILLYALSGTLCMLSACSDDDNGTPPAGTIEMLEPVADYGTVQLRWKAPLADPNYYYTSVQWIDQGGTPRTANATRFAADADGVTALWLDGFAREEALTFTLTPYNKTGAAGTPTTTEAKPKNPAYEVVQKSVSISDPKPGEVTLEWLNPTRKTLYIEVSYNVDGRTSTRTIATDTVATGTVVVSGLPAGEFEFTVRVRDAYKNYASKPYVSEKLTIEGIEPEPEPEPEPAA
jgi:hypothetical protein